MKMLRYSSLTGIVAFAIIFPLFSTEGADSYSALSVIPITRKPAPDFSLKQVDGKPIKLSSYRGDLVLLGFFKTF